jgi:hypothetical protein
MRMNDEDCYEFMVEDAKRYFGQWDMCDPVAWAILRVVQAQTTSRMPSARTSFTAHRSARSKRPSQNATKPLPPCRRHLSASRAGFNELPALMAGPITHLHCGYLLDLICQSHYQRGPHCRIGPHLWNGFNRRRAKRL